MTELNIIITYPVHFRQALHNVVNQPGTMEVSCILGDSSSDEATLSRITELSAGGNGELKEETLTDIPKIEWCQMVRVSSTFSCIRVSLNIYPT